jgi:hypothetical protein
MINFEPNVVENPTWDSKELLADGIAVYRNVFKKDMKIISRLENSLTGKNPNYFWREALVGYAKKMPEYRDCVDFKYRKENLLNDKSIQSVLLQEVWQDCYDLQLPAVKDYSHFFRVGELRYWESFNFIKYGPGQHFQEHHDQGPTYNCVVSLVGYLNDDYEGGELDFRLQGIKVKPRAGDLYIFPSNYMYPHTAMPVVSGTKYSLVTMLDYSAKFHRPDLHEETND